MNTIEETIKLAGFGRRKAMKKQIELMENKLQEGEKLLGVICSTPKPTDQIYVTNKKVIAHKITGVFGNNFTDIPLSSISSINLNQKGLLNTELEIVTSNNKAVAEHLPLPVAQEIKKLIDSLIYQ